MTEQLQQPHSDAVTASDQLPDNIGSNGTHPDATVAIADIPGTDAPTSDEGATPLAGEAGETDESHQDVTPLDDGTAFQTQLIRAMQEAAGAERTRVIEDIERRRAEHLETIRARKESGTASIRDLAADDLKAIDDWARAEHQRINVERNDRATALDADLEASLAEHDARIDTEIEAVEAAIAGYRTEVDAYFVTMETANDPVEIAQHAARQPVFPDLGAVSSSQSETTQVAPDETPVAVMDPEVAADPASAWARWNETGALPEVTVPPTAPATSTGETAPSGSLLQSIPASRPYGAYRESTQDQETTVSER